VGVSHAGVASELCDVFRNGESGNSQKSAKCGGSLLVQEEIGGSKKPCKI